MGSWVLTGKPEPLRGRPKASDSMPIEEILEKALTTSARVGYDGMSLRTCWGGSIVERVLTEKNSKFSQ